MKLLFDQNLSYKLVEKLASLFPESAQARILGLDTVDDRILWKYARENRFTLVTQDADFAELAFALGHPPKVVWLRCGNQPTETIARLLCEHAEAISDFANDETTACMEIY